MVSDGCKLSLTDTPRVHLETIEGLPHPDDGSGGGVTPEMMRSKGPVVHLDKEN